MPGIKVDLPLLHRVCAVANAAGTGHISEVIGYLRSMAGKDPDRLVSVVALLAAAASEHAGTPERVLLATENLTADFDFSAIAREGVRMYEEFRRRDELLLLPAWAGIAHRIYGRLQSRARARQARAG